MKVRKTAQHEWTVLDDRDNFVAAYRTRDAARRAVVYYRERGPSGYSTRAEARKGGGAR